MGNQDKLKKIITGYNTNFNIFKTNYIVKSAFENYNHNNMQNSLKGITASLNAFSVSISKMVSPLKEITEKISEITKPMVDVLNKISFTSIQPYFSELLEIFKQAQENPDSAWN